MKPSVLVAGMFVVAGAASGAWSGDLSTGILAGAAAGLMIGGTVWAMGGAEPKPFTRTTFERMSKMLSARGLSITRAEYHWRSFGSWTIEIAATPPVRVIWDGKERCLSVEKQTEEVHPYFGLNIYEPIVDMTNPHDEMAALERAADAASRQVAV